MPEIEVSVRERSENIRAAKTEAEAREHVTELSKAATPEAVEALLDHALNHEIDGVSRISGAALIRMANMGKYDSGEIIDEIMDKLSKSSPKAHARGFGLIHKL